MHITYSFPAVMNLNLFPHIPDQSTWSFTSDPSPTGTPPALPVFPLTPSADTLDFPNYTLLWVEYVLYINI